MSTIRQFWKKSTFFITFVFFKLKIFDMETYGDLARRLKDATRENRKDEIILISNKLSELEREMPRHNTRCTCGDYYPVQKPVVHYNDPILCTKEL
jgi:hypothetical protein